MDVHFNCLSFWQRNVMLANALADIPRSPNRIRHRLRDGNRERYDLLLAVSDSADKATVEGYLEAMEAQISAFMKVINPNHCLVHDDSLTSSQPKFSSMGYDLHTFSVANRVLRWMRYIIKHLKMLTVHDHRLHLSCAWFWSSDGKSFGLRRWVFADHFIKL